MVSDVDVEEAGKEVNVLPEKDDDEEDQIKEEENKKNEEDKEEEKSATNISSIKPAASVKMRKRTKKVVTKHYQDEEGFMGKISYKIYGQVTNQSIIFLVWVLLFLQVFH